MPNDPRTTKAERRDEARNQAIKMREEQKRRETRTRVISIVGLVAALVVLALVIALIWNQRARNVTYTGERVEITDVARPAGTRADGGVAVGADGVAGAEIEGVEVELYLDLMCPACNLFEETNAADLTDLRESGDATVVYHVISFLDSKSQGTDYSTRAANAAAVIADKAPDKYLAFLDAMFANQPAELTPGLKDDEIAQIALDAGVPQDVVNQFTSLASEGEWRQFAPYIAVVTANAQDKLVDEEGQFGTPTLLINGEQFAADWGEPGAVKAAVLAARS